MAESERTNIDKLVVIWSTNDRETALSNVFMYTRNSKLKGWWGEVRLVVWGPSAKLLAVDKELQDNLISLKEAGVELQACQRCAEMYDVVNELEDLEISVILMGAPLTEMLKEGWTVLTY